MLTLTANQNLPRLFLSTQSLFIILYIYIYIYIYIYVYIREYLLFYIYIKFVVGPMRVK